MVLFFVCKGWQFPYEIYTTSLNKNATLRAILLVIGTVFQKQWLHTHTYQTSDWRQRMPLSRKGARNVLPCVDLTEKYPPRLQISRQTLSSTFPSQHTTWRNDSTMWHKQPFYSHNANRPRECHCKSIAK